MQEAEEPGRLNLGPLAAQGRRGVDLVEVFGATDSLSIVLLDGGHVIFDSVTTDAVEIAGQFAAGPEYGESENTVAILADEGIRYVCDWPNDDQPYPMKTPHR